MKEQDFKIIITAKADVTDKAVRDWLPQALQEGDFGYKLTKIYSTEIEPIDRSDSSNKYLDDIDATGC